MPLVVLQGKVSQEVLEQFKKAQEESESMTFNAFMEVLLESYLNPKTKEIQVPIPTTEQEQALQLKDNEIGRLETQINLLQEAGTIFEVENNNLKSKVQELEARPPVKINELAENQALITFPPIVALVLDKERAIAQKRSGKEFSREDILLNTFWDGIINGAAYPFRVWSAADLAQLKKQIPA